MTDATIQALAQRAGIATEWRDYSDAPHQVPIAALKRILTALGLPSDTPNDLAHSQHILADAEPPVLITATAGQAIDLPFLAGSASRSLRVVFEDGTVNEHPARGGAHGIQLSGIDRVGYHSVVFQDRSITLAVAPPRCVTARDLTNGAQSWGLTAQIYALRSPGDCGIGDTAGVSKLAASAAKENADALGLSPIHALFSADPAHFSPYSPSSRLFYNPLHADVRTLFGEVRFAKAMADAGAEASAADVERPDLIDWQKAAGIKLSVLRRLFDDFCSVDLLPKKRTPLGLAFTEFRKAEGEALERHARFEALHAHQLKASNAEWSWRKWPAALRSPDTDAVKVFAADNEAEITFHCFLQWIAARAIDQAQRSAKAAGMRIGLIADLAIGMSGAGSHAWSSPNDILGGLEIGAPPDLYNANGQNWGLTTFSPRALHSRGYAPFLATLRACLKHAGGLRIDHVMGLQRLWVVPEGADPKDGAYLTYPLNDLLRLIALESCRHQAVIIGEDLGTVPAGFRDHLERAGIYGMRVLFFERERRHFIPPQQWSTDAAAMTSTHDLPPVASWWRGADIEMRTKLKLLDDPATEEGNRIKERRMLWRAFRRSGSAAGPSPAPSEPHAVADAAVRFLAQTQSALALLPLEDALALEEQPNVPGTVKEHRNWQRRYRGVASDLLAGADTKKRIAPLSARSRR